MSGVPWTEEEERILIEFYPHSGGISESQRRLPRRSAHAIRTRASLLGLGRRERAAAYFKKLREPLFRKRAA